MPAPTPTPELPAKDKLLTRPADPIPSVRDPHSGPAHPTDPKPVPAGGQGTDPKAGDLGRSA